jgi:hypothetical protein
MDNINIVNLDDYQKKHIAVLCLPGLESFLPAIVEHLGKKHFVRTCYSKSLQEMEELIAWADLVILEWANELAVELTQKSKMLEEKRVIIRLHSYEALSGYVQHIKWSVVDSLIFVASHIKDLVLKQMPGLENPELNPPEIFVISNGVPI